MSKFPSGWILIPIIDHKGLELVVEQEELITCKECKYFVYNVWEKVNGIPIIVAHEMCNKWGDGCQTKENGYCFLAEKQEEVT